MVWYRMKNKILRIINENLIFSPFLFILILLYLLYPNEIKNYPYFVAWRTIGALAGLLIITTAIKESGYFLIVTKRISKKANTERKIALFLILSSCIFATFLTNDIALFIIIPLTLSFQKFIENDIKKIVIFEAIAVNAGSLLTPIGNPQNLFLWHQWNISFLDFMTKMFPVFLLLFVFLIIFTLVIFPSKKLSIQRQENATELNKGLFFLSILLLVGYIVALESGLTYYVLPAIFLIYLVFFRNILIKSDWFLIMLFIVIFIDFHLISRIQIISNFVNSYNLNSSSTVFTFSLLSSQIISNVPASIFMSKFSHNWLSIAYGVNVGGNGTVIASLANIIALRFVRDRKIWIEFHKYSLIYLLITGGLVYVLFFR